MTSLSHPTASRSVGSEACLKVHFYSPTTKSAEHAHLLYLNHNMDTEVKVPFFKKKGKGRPTTSRKRSTSPPASALAIDVPSPSRSEVVLPSRKVAGNLLSAGTKRTASQRQDEDDTEESPRDGPDVKWTAQGSHINAALEILKGDEAMEMLRKKKKRDGSDEEDVPDDGLYRGQKAYKSHIQKSKEIPKAMRVGPQRQSGSTIRTVTIIDYQPDVCKDYKGTLLNLCFPRPPDTVADLSSRHKKQVTVVLVIRVNFCTIAEHVSLVFETPHFFPQED